MKHALENVETSWKYGVSDLGPPRAKPSAKIVQAPEARSPSSGGAFANPLGTPRRASMRKYNGPLVPKPRPPSSRACSKIDRYIVSLVLGKAGPTNQGVRNRTV